MTERATAAADPFMESERELTKLMLSAQWNLVHGWALRSSVTRTISGHFQTMVAAV
jgi:hypothetical protein